MIVLGIGGSTHDFSACLVIDGEVRVAVEEERLSRIKHHSLDRLRLADMRLRSVDYCLQAAGVTLDDVDVVVANDLVFRGVLRSLPGVMLVNHHLSHAALVSYLSPDPAPAILVIDGFGSMASSRAETVSYFTAGDDRVPQLLYRETNPVRRRAEGKPFSWKNFDFVENSIGELYSFVTAGIGFGPYNEGKTMGLAPYGSLRLVDPMLDIVEVDGIGDVRFDDTVRKQLGRLIEDERDIGDSWQRRADVARAMQAVLERSLARRVADLHRRTGLSALAVGGGVFLNSVANRLIRQEGPFDSFYVHGATGDSGTAIGAALYAYHQRTGSLPRRGDAIYLGREYSREETLAALREVPGVAWTEEADVCGRVAEILAGGGIVGWFQGRSEFGPRALGNRSILADPSRPGMKDRINSVVKHREGFRPFAPAVLGDRQRELLDTGWASPYMCVNAMVLPEAHDCVVAASHVDLSARYQTVTDDSNPRFAELIRRFAEHTGVPALLNTSFNDNEPIVESPRDALACFQDNEIDCLVLNDFVVTRG